MCGQTTSRSHPSRELSLIQVALLDQRVAKFSQQAQNVDPMSPLPAHRITFEYGKGGVYKGVHVEVDRCSD